MSFPQPLRVRHLSLTLMALLLLAATAGTARAERYGNIIVTATPPPSANTTHGYARYTFRITNRSPDRTHSVTVRLPAQRYSRGERISWIGRTVRVGPGDSLEADLYQPPLPMDGRDAAVFIDGERQRDNVSLASGAMGHMSNHGRRSYRAGPSGTAGPAIDVLISPAINRSDLIGSFDRAVFGDVESSGSRAGRAREFVQSNDPPDRWPDRWLAYSRYDGVMLTADEIETLPGSIRAALTAYVEVGGTLVVLGDWTPPDRWTRRARTDAGMRLFPLGFGTAIVSPVADPMRWDAGNAEPAPSWAPVRENFERTRQPWGGRFSVSDAHDNFPVVDELGVPVRGLFALMIVFAVLIGPVNLLVLNRVNRRIWLLWTVPAISLLFCGAVFAYNIVAEGWTPRLRTQLITRLDQPARRAASIGWTACYAPLTPGGGLRFEDDTELTPQVSFGRYSNEGTARTVDWSAGQHLRTGWVSARVPAHFKIRRAHNERRRIDIEPQSDGTLTATNGLGVRVRQIVYMDAEGVLHDASDLPPTGDATTLNATATRSEDYTPWLQEAYRRAWLAALNRTTKDNRGDGSRLRPGEYIAILESSPFLEPGLDGAATRHEPSVVYGITKHANAGNAE